MTDVTKETEDLAVPENLAVPKELWELLGCVNESDEELQLLRKLTASSKKRLFKDCAKFNAARKELLWQRWAAAGKTWCSYRWHVVDATSVKFVYLRGKRWAGSSEHRTPEDFAEVHSVCPSCSQLALDVSGTTVSAYEASQSEEGVFWYYNPLDDVSRIVPPVFKNLTEPGDIGAALAQEWGIGPEVDVGGGHDDLHLVFSYG